MQFHSKQGKIAIIIYVVLILGIYLFYAPMGFWLFWTGEGTRYLFFSMGSLFVGFTFIQNVFSSNYTVIFREHEVSFKRLWMKEVLSYEDIEQIRYVKTRAKMGYAYTVEVKRKDKWSSLYFSTTFLQNTKERESFKRAWRKHANMNFKHRKGYFLY